MLLAFHNDESIRDKYLDRVGVHALNCCDVGCILDDRDCGGPLEIGFPIELMRLQEAICDGRLYHAVEPERFDRCFVRDLLSAPRLGTDLSLVCPRFTHWLLTADDSPQVVGIREREFREPIAGIAALFAKWIESGERPPRESFDAAAASLVNDAKHCSYSPVEAYDAALCAAYAAILRPGSCARLAADAAADAEISRQVEADEDINDSESRRLAWSAMRGKLLELLAVA